MGVLGSKSGRDVNKIDEVGFDVEMVDNQPTFKQVKMTFVCKKLYKGKITPEGFIDDKLDNNYYPEKDYHYVYIGEIENAYVNEKD